MRTVPRCFGFAFAPSILPSQFGRRFFTASSLSSVKSGLQIKAFEDCQVSRELPSLCLRQVAIFAEHVVAQLAGGQLAVSLLAAQDAKNVKCR